MKFADFFKENKNYIVLKNKLIKGDYEDVKLLIDVVNEAMIFGMKIYKEDLTNALYIIKKED